MFSSIKNSIFNIVIIFLVLSVYVGKAQCNLTPYYYGVITPSLGTTSITTNYSPGANFRMPVLNGGSYAISTCSASINTQLTGWNPTGSSIVFYNDDNGPLCSGISASIDNYIPNFTDYLRVNVTENNCTFSTTSSVNVYIRQNNNIVFTSSSAAMCSGSTRTLSATPASVGTITNTLEYGSGGEFSGIGVAGNIFSAPTVTAPTTYTITYTFGFVSQTQTITVNPLPSIAVNSGAICAGNSFTMIPSGASSYTFSSGSAVVSPTITTSYSVTGSNIYGCFSNTAISNVIVNVPPIAPASTSLVPSSGTVLTVYTTSLNSSCKFPMLNGGSYGLTTCSTPYDSQVFGFDPISSSLLFFNNDNGPFCSGTAASVDNVIPNFTDYVDVDIAEFSCTLGVISTINVSVRQNNNIVFTSSSSNMCPGLTRSLTATPLSIGVSPNAVDFGDGGTFSGVGVSGNVFTAPTVTVPTTFTITYTFGFVNKTQTITVVPPSVVSVNSGTLCAGGSFTMTPSGANTYTFSSGSAVVSPTVTSTYTVTGTDALGCSNVAVSNVIVNVPPIALTSTTLTPLSGTTLALYTTTINTRSKYPMLKGGSYGLTTCGAPFDTQVFGFNPIGSSIVFFNNDNGPFCSGTAASVDNVSPNFTDYVDVNISENNTCVPNTNSTINVSVRQNNNIVFTSSSSDMCSGLTRTLTATPLSIGTSPNAVDFGDGGSFSGVGVSGNIFTAPTVTVPTTFTITYTFGFVSRIQTITVNPNVTVNSGTLCSGNSFTMTPAGGSSYTYSGGSSIVSPTVSSSYTVTGVNAYGCINTAVCSITVYTCYPAAALDFDGNDDYVLVYNNSLFNTNQFTIETWLQWGNSGTNVGFICGKDIEQMEIHTGGGSSNNIRFIPVPGVYLDAGVNAITPGTWVHVACVYDPNRAMAKMYINGVDVPLTLSGTNPLTTPVPITPNNIVIGSRANLGFPFKGKLDEFRIWNVARTECEINNYKNCEIPNGAAGLIVNYHFNEGYASIPNPSILSLPDASGNNLNGVLNTFSLTGSNSNWVAPGAVITGSVTPATYICASALDFDGTDDYMSTPGIINSTSGTWEAWVKKSDWTQHNDDRLFGNGINFSDPNSFYVSLHPVVGLHYRYGGTGQANNIIVASLYTQTLSANSWHHIAGTWENNGSVTTLKLYLDGALLGTNSTTSLFSINTATSFIGGGGDPANPFFGSGQMDEVRLWNVARTQCEINTYKDCEIPSSASGLLANYHFNQGLASSANPIITRLIDESGNNSHGLLNAFALVGNSSNWVAPGGVVTSYTTPLAPLTVGANVTYTLINIGSSITLNGTGANTYSWTGGITDGVAFSPSVTSTYTVTGLSTITQCSNTAMSTVEVNTSPLPIELLYFNAELTNQNTVNISWATASEMNNEYYLVQRSYDANSWHTLFKVNAAGTSVVLNEYNFFDTTPLSGLSYYRLKQVDFSGDYSFSNIESVELNYAGSVKIIPNPFTEMFTLEFSTAKPIKQINIYNSIGQIIKSMQIQDANQGKIIINFSDLPKGIYYLRTDDLMINEKLIKQ